MIYDHPRDYPNDVVVRAQHIVRGYREPVLDARAFTFDTLEEARTFCAAQGTSGFFTRSPEDDPYIVESWM